MKPIIEVDHLYKKYQIGQKQPYYSLRDSIVNFVKSPVRSFGKLKKNEFWALDNVSLKVNPGEIIGIIGRNGAGKSTLLKILSQITPPTKGEITLRGRVASLLEIGTGFHPELTGRENIFLNGAILGMKRSEIKSKFNQIVDFAEIQKFLDTPIKYYSSGMHTRLAFAVAAHLEPEILLIDEVLAVGDSEFQKKCLGKMQDISENDGRTIIFVSHNTKAIEQLCEKCVLLEKGRVKMIGETSMVVGKYLNQMIPSTKNEIKLAKNFNTDLSFSKISIMNKDRRISYHIPQDEDFIINLELNVFKETKNVDVSISISNSQNTIIFSSLSDNNNGQLGNFGPGKYQFKIKFSGGYLMPDNYFIRISVHRPGTENLDTREDVLGFTISPIQQGNRALNYGRGCVSLPNKWFLEK
jgi:lipopolysaccharide transport system ATP-binding protein